MAETREIELQFPVRGLVRSSAVQQQAPYSTPKCQNVRPRDTFEDRIRGGSRPGLTNAYQDDLVEPIQMLASVRPIATAGGGIKAYGWGATPAGSIAYDTLQHAASHKTGTATNVAYWDDWANDVIPEGSVGVSPTETISAIWLPNPPSGSTYQSAYIHTAIDDQDTADGITYAMRVMRRSPWLLSTGLHLWKGNFYIFGGMDSGLDPTQDGWILECKTNFNQYFSTYGRLPVSPAEFVIANSYHTFIFTRYLGGSQTHTVTYNTQIFEIAYGSMPIEILVTNNTSGSPYFNISVRVGETTVVDHQDTTPGNEDAGYRWGFGLKNPGETGTDLKGLAISFPVIDYINYIYKPTTSTAYRKRQLIAVADGDLWVENDALQMEALTSDLTLNPDAHLQCVEYDGKVIIADYGDIVYEHTGGNGTITSGALDLSAGAPADWQVALGVSGNNFKDWVVEHIEHSSGNVIGTYRITAVGTGDITVKKKDGTTSPANTTGIDFRIQRGPKVYDPDAGTLDLYMSDAGSASDQVPTGCQLISTFQDRIVLSRNSLRPGLWFMSRQSDAYDWDLSADPTDIGRAIIGSSTDAGILPDPITAAISGINDYMLFSTDNNLWLLRGNPLAGGRIDSISRVVGIAHPEAYCYGPSGEIIILTRDGLYAIAPDAAATPVPLSRPVLPKELVNINTTTTRILMQYNVIDQGVHIFVTNEAGATGRHFWYDYQTKGFWPEQYQLDHEPYSIHSHLVPGEDQRIVLIGCRDGFIRRFSVSARADDGTAISSFVDYGPLQLGPAGQFEGLVSQLNARLSASGNQVTWELRVGDTPEEASLADPLDTGTWLPGLNYTDRPRARGAYAYLRILNETANRAWAVETIFMAVKRAGRLRKV